MACTIDYAQNIISLSAGRLDAQAVEELLDHVETCSPCSDDLDAAADAVAVLEHETRASPTRRARLTRIAVAAAILAVAGLGWLAVIDDGSGSSSPVADIADLTPLPAPQSVLRGPEDATSSAWEAAAAAYAQERWAAAGEAFEALFGDAVRAPAALLYAGIARAQAGEYDAALDALRRAEEVAGGLMLEQVLWYRAAVELMTGDEAAARSTLSRLIEVDGDYLLNARDQLELLDARRPR